MIIKLETVQITKIHENGDFNIYCDQCRHKGFCSMAPCFITPENEKYFHVGAWLDVFARDIPGGSEAFIRFHDEPA